MSDEEELTFSINKAYADKYNRWREKEELQKLKDRYGDAKEESSSSSESEDEDAKDLTPQLNKDFLRTLAAIKFKNPRIYEKDAQFYDSVSEESVEGDQEKKPKKPKPMFIKDYDREVLLKKDGKVGEYEGESEDEDEPKPKSYYEEQEDIVKSFKTAGDDSGSEDEFLVQRKKTKEEKEAEEEEYRQWLMGQKEELIGDEKEGEVLNPLKQYWTDPKLSQGDQFLRDFILEKKYLDKDDELPTYDDIVEDEDLEEDEEELEKQEAFEHKYNFRYEEPDADFIKSFPRTIGDSMRRKDTSRVEKRKKTEDRKKEEKQKKKEELKQLKNLKRREILNKIEKLKEITGNDALGVDDIDLDGDFDPAAHDKMMKEMFSGDYYDEEGMEEEKPVFPQDDADIELEDGWDEWQGGDEEFGEGQGELHCDDPNFIMDADYDPNRPQQEERELNLSKKKRKKGKLKAALEKKKPVFDPNEKTFEEYFNEYYKLDYEDIVADQPCRFRYREVVANDYGLSVEEILGAEDKELNQWVSVKRMSQYRTDEEEKFDVRIYKKKTHDPKKLQILRSLAESVEEEPTEEATKKKRKKKKKKGAAAVANETAGAPSGGTKRKMEEEEGVQSSQSSPKKAKKTASESSPTKKDKQSNQTEGKKADTPSKKAKKKMSVEGKNANQPAVDSSESKEQKEDIEETKSESAGNDKQKDSAPKKKKKKVKRSEVSAMTDERLKAYGINPKKFKYTQKKATTSSS